MNTLTASLLANFPYLRFADAGSYQRGRQYYQENRVFEIHLAEDDRSAVCYVEGDSGTYEVNVKIDHASDDLEFFCDCPYGENHFCKHMVAAGLELRDYLEHNRPTLEEQALENFKKNEPESVLTPPPPAATAWRAQLNTVFQRIPRGASAKPRLRMYAAVLLLTHEEYYYQSYYAFTPYIIKSANWSPLENFTQDDAQAVTDLLSQDLQWMAYGEEFSSQTNPNGCLNLDSEGFAILSAVHQLGRFYQGLSAAVNYLPLMARLNVPVFLASKTKKKAHQRLEVLSQPVDLQMDLRQEGEVYTLQLALVNAAFPPGSQQAAQISSSPPWFLMNNLLFTLRNPAQIHLVPEFPIHIPQADIETFRSNYLARLAQSFPLHSDLIAWREAQGEPVARLYLSDTSAGSLQAQLRFGYGDLEVDPGRSPETETIESRADSWEIVKLARRPDVEARFLSLLSDPAYRLKRPAGMPPGTFELRARVHPYDFLLHTVPLLTQAGLEIYGEDHLKAGRMNRSTPSLKVNITSGIDWFDLQATVEYGDQEVSFKEIRKLLKRGERFVKLADGTIGQIPEEWLEKYGNFWDFAKESEDGYRVADFHLSLLDQLLEDSQDTQLPADLAERRARLASFDQIEPQPLPAGFTGELRPYQKHGFDWLHFLHTYKFGGILADDMGLGKTIQVLALLQSLKERIQPAPVTLLVVPKSLVANWQREAERFTPHLRFLEYLGTGRNREEPAFDQYDVVLTTYGTMLRDIEILSQYRFHQVVLDESQAIKNPMAKSARAARLLKADHRLVMTGTPVENNIFELWSQFAFINPGLLGSMDYFRHEYGAPIHVEKSEKAAAALRRLVFPFILRRTKAQVAAELPPRTERILYVDMAPAQKKLYAQTREYYRAELMGLTDVQDMQNNRLKILEGLLRLRQVAIHPALITPTYRGDAPKFEVLLDTLETLQGEQHKALIFSQFVETLNLLRRELDQRGLRYEYLTGRTRDRQKHVDAFQEDPRIPFFLISLKAGGVGLNLTAADYVFHLDPWWNPAVEMQASDRAHRIGQDKPVFIYKIITRGSVEEKILQLQEQKLALVEDLIAPEESFFKSLSNADVRDLFA